MSKFRVHDKGSTRWIVVRVLGALAWCGLAGIAVANWIPCSLWGQILIVASGIGVLVLLIKAWSD